MRGREGVDLHTAHHPVSSARGGVVLVHGYGEHSGRYGHVIAALNEAGYSVYTLDHRGHGRSSGTRALVDRFDYIVEDLHAFIEGEVTAAHGAAHPGKPLFVFGHSMGGLITLTYAVRFAEADGIAGLISSAGPVLADLENPFLLTVARILDRIMPNAVIADTVPRHALSRDPAVLAAFDADPLTWKRKMRVRTGVQLADAARWAREHLGEIRLPILLIHGEDDIAVPVASGRLAHDAIASADKQLITYPGLRHETLNEPERDQVIAAIVTWLHARDGGG
jgi:alpha-beta hydrolase superfamily lysophospholipase